MFGSKFLADSLFRWIYKYYFFTKCRHHKFQHSAWSIYATVRIIPRDNTPGYNTKNCAILAGAGSCSLVYGKQGWSKVLGCFFVSFGISMGGFPFHTQGAQFAPIWYSDGSQNNTFRGIEMVEILKVYFEHPRTNFLKRPLSPPPCLSKTHKHKIRLNWNWELCLFYIDIIGLYNTYWATFVHHKNNIYVMITNCNMSFTLWELKLSKCHFLLLHYPVLGPWDMGNPHSTTLTWRVHDG